MLSLANYSLGALAERVVRWTCDEQVVGSILLGAKAAYISLNTKFRIQT